MSQEAKISFLYLLTLSWFYSNIWGSSQEPSSAILTTELFHPYIHFTSECQSQGGEEHHLGVCLVCSSQFASVSEQLTWMESCRSTGSEAQGTGGLLRRFGSAGVYGSTVKKVCKSRLKPLLKLL